MPIRLYIYMFPLPTSSSQWKGDRRRYTATTDKRDVELAKYATFKKRLCGKNNIKTKLCRGACLIPGRDKRSHTHESEEGCRDSVFFRSAARLRHERHVPRKQTEVAAHSPTSLGIQRISRGTINLPSAAGLFVNLTSARRDRLGPRGRGQARTEDFSGRKCGRGHDRGEMGHCESVHKGSRRDGNTD
ncbi:hypothetical protein EVAR_16278_1 [Eumeta japonica]|uniref:Uncharacterized protein n=1 Tax=Eumeta variegata TaxID=151549 RepID=A0A4C1U6K8_EUMVA|nr:hypothetical protein EVAR_16278_1 [Eumeta japonica]